MIRCETSDLTLDRTLRAYCHSTIYIHFLFWKEKASISSPPFSVYGSLSRLYNPDLYSRRLTPELGLSELFTARLEMRAGTCFYHDCAIMEAAWRGELQRWLTREKASIILTNARKTQTFFFFFLGSGARRSIWDARQQLPLIIIINTAGARPEDRA